MGMDLIGPRRNFAWNVWAWSTVLRLAQRHGWEPMGTGPHRKWGYDSNDGQLVYAKDAKMLADALEAFLNAPRPRRVPKKEAWFWSPVGKGELRKFVAFCRKGSFRIH
jgi:hypothetical protein